MASRGRERSGVKSASSKLMTIELNGERLVIDNASMTLRERQVLRAELAKLPAEADSMDWTAGAVWIALRRTDPSVTFDDVCDSLTIGDIGDLEMVEPEVDDPEA